MRCQINGRTAAAEKTASSDRLFIGGLTINSKQSIPKYSDEAIERLLDALAGLCCDSLAGGAPSLVERSAPILRTLASSGVEPFAQGGLDETLSDRILRRRNNPTFYHRREIIRLTQALQKKFDALAASARERSILDRK